MADSQDTSLRTAGKALLRELLLGFGGLGIVAGLILITIGAVLQGVVNSETTGCLANPTCRLNQTAVAADTTRVFAYIAGGIVLTVVAIGVLISGVRIPKVRPPKVT